MTSTPQGYPLAGTTLFRRAVPTTTSASAYSPAPSQPLVSQSVHVHEDDDSYEVWLNQNNERRYHNLRTCTIIILVLSLLILAAVVVGFIVVGLMVRDIQNTVDSTHDEVGKIWKSLHGGHGDSNDWKKEEDDIKWKLHNLEKWTQQLLWLVKWVKVDVRDVKNCTEEIKSNIGNFTDCSELESEVADIKNCTEIIKVDLGAVDTEVRTVKRDVQDVLTCTNTIKQQVSNVSESVDTLGKLPLARVLCGQPANITLPALTNVLISTDLNPQSPFPTSTSVDYNSDTGAIVFLPPNIGVDEQVILHVEARVLISEAGGPNLDEDGTYSFIMSTSDSCGLAACEDGIYSTTRRYVTTDPEDGEGSLWLNLNTKINVDGSGVRLYFFVRSNTGNGVIMNRSDDASSCATLWLSFQALAPTFVLGDAAENE